MFHKIKRMIASSLTTYTNVGSDLKTFLVTNNILTTMASVTMAFSTGTMIRSLVSDIILPSIYGLFVSRIKPLSGVLSGAFAPINKLNFDNFLKELFQWVVVIVITFMLIEYVVRRWILKVYPTTPTPVTPEKKVGTEQEFFGYAPFPRVVTPEKVPVVSNIQNEGRKASDAAVSSATVDVGGDGADGGGVDTFMNGRDPFFEQYFSY